MDWEILLVKNEVDLLLFLTDDDAFFDYLDSVDDIEEGDAS